MLRAFVLVAAVLAAMPSPSLAQPPASGDALARFAESVRRAWPPQGTTMHGAVKFVHGNDLWQPGRQFKAGTEWLGLACDPEGCALEPAALAVKRESWQGHYDESPTQGQKLKFRLETPSKERAVVAWFFTPGSPSWVKARAVSTSRSPTQPLRRPPGRGTLEVAVDMPGGGEALLVPLLLDEPTQRSDPGIGPGVALQLRVKGARQLLPGLLATCFGPVDPKRYLLWAGDLDGDGRLDLLVSFVGAEGPVHLYLSSAAKAGQLVGLAGVYSSPPFGGECDGG